MKRQVGYSILGVIVILSLVFVVNNSQRVFATTRPTLPTPAPTATPGNPPPNLPSVPLAQPLNTKDLAIERVLQYDHMLSTWGQPWSKDTLALEPSRITIESYPSRTAESVAAHELDGLKEGFAPEIDADAGLVWTIHIKGDVRVTLPSPRENSASIIYDGVTYVISQRTGNLLTVRTGMPKQ